MSNPPRREDRISDYLDHQMSPTMRAEFETQLENDADLRALLEVLDRQSRECGAFPAYSLDSGFAERVISDPRAEEALSTKARHHAIVADASASYAISNPLRTAALAILSLAALVLVSLFMQNPEDNGYTPALGKAPENERADLNRARDDGLSRKAGQDEFGKLGEDSIGAGDSIELGSRMSERDDGIQVVESNSNSIDFNILDQNVEPKKLQIYNGQVESFVPIMKSADRSGLQSVLPPAIQDSTEIEDFNKDVDEQFLLDPSEPIVEDSSRGAKQYALPLEGQTPTLQTEANPPTGLIGFIEVSYPDESAMLIDFKNALGRNGIVFDLQLPSNKDQLDQPRNRIAAEEKSAAPGAKSGALGGRSGTGGLAGQGGESESQPPELADKFQPEIVVPGETEKRSPGSQLFLITATPQQMVGLISDLQGNAEVSRYRMPELKTQDMPVPTREATLQFDLLAEGRGQFGAGVDSAAERLAQSVPALSAGQELSPKKDRPPSAGWGPTEQVPVQAQTDSEQLLDGKPDLPGTALGIAVPLQQFELREDQRKQGDPISKSEIETPDASRKLQAKAKNVGQSDNDELSFHFETQADNVNKTNSMPRQYLLLVHSRDAAVDDQAKSESRNSVPVPADASESEK